MRTTGVLRRELGMGCTMGEFITPLHNQETERWKFVTKWNSPTTTLGGPYLWDERSRQDTAPRLHIRAFGAATRFEALLKRVWKTRFRIRDPSWSQCPLAWHLESGTFWKRWSLPDRLCFWKKNLDLVCRRIVVGGVAFRRRQPNRVCDGNRRKK